MTADFECNVMPPAARDQQLELQRRRDLALRATDAISEVLEVETTIPMLQALVDDEEREVHLIAVRALRCVESIARKDSEVVRLIGETGIYHYVEGVIDYGASERTWLKLVEDHDLSAAEATAIYSLRELVAEESDGKMPSFGNLAYALGSIGMTMGEAAADPYVALAKFDQAGYFVDHAGLRNFNRPIFWPQSAGADIRLVDSDVDGTISREIVMRHQDELSLPPEEREE